LSMCAHVRDLVSQHLSGGADSSELTVVMPSIMAQTNEIIPTR
jgi:hypothetical protein